MDASKIREPIPEFDTLEEIANFWDTHSTADDDDLTQEVYFAVTLPDERQPVRLLPELGRQLAAWANRQGVSLETVVNVWLTEKLSEARQHNNGFG
jgi:hypothetical protein